ncbi:MAG: serine/threonine protein kinase [Gammaproteobacteria bacterium RIFCSPLOWO2_02_FULL_56_15]|nr:MAG: serine/threonine protein kinase [Acidobacteria bacterium RIFCSPLOWO2_12_FULL_54_10]OGT71617.1 MAG: serine/threonine protein kinase [Gammaproteobacteria bacterium RIFCSPLOWO2_02_FULL_56_15]
MSLKAEIHIPINSDADIVTARQQGRELAQQAGFNGSDLTVISTAISEVARNIVEHARSGEIVLSVANGPGRSGLVVVARDHGPGILDISLAMQDGYSTGKGLGLGLPGTRRLMDEFEITSKPGAGTTVTMKKWRR